MSQILLHWINNEVGLSKQIINVDFDFQDGYLLGELLNKYNQQSDFHLFSTKQSTESKLNNFCRLEPTLRRLGVHFNSQTAVNIIDGNSGVALGILYQLKTIIERLVVKERHNYFKGKSVSKSNPENTLTVLHPPRAFYDQTKSLTFENAVRNRLENPKESSVNRAISPFKENKNRFRDHIHQDYDQMLLSMSENLQSTKSLHVMRKKEKEATKQEIENKYLEQWQKNLSTAKERNALRQKVDTMTKQFQKSKVQESLLKSKTNMKLQLDDFDRRLEKLIITTNATGGSDEKLGDEELQSSSDHGLQLPTNLFKLIEQKDATGRKFSVHYMDETVLSEGLKVDQERLKEHNDKKLAHQIQRDNRRRKFVHQSESSLVGTAKQFYEYDLTSQLLNQCISEESESYLHQKVLLYKTLIAVDRQNRDDLCQRIVDFETQNEKNRQKNELLDVIKVTILQSVESQLDRSAALDEAIEQANAQSSVEVVQEMVNKLLDVVDWVTSCRSLGLYNYNLDSETEYHNTKQFNHNFIKLNNHEVFKIKRNADVAPTTTALSLVAEMDDDEFDFESLPPPIPAAMMKDAVHMFTADTRVAESILSPLPFNATMALYPYSISHRPLCMDSDWLLAKPIASLDVFVVNSLAVPVADSMDSASIALSLEEGKVEAVTETVGRSEQLQTFTQSTDVKEPFDRTTHPVTTSEMIVEAIANIEAQEFVEDILTTKNLNPPKFGPDDLSEAPNLAMGSELQPKKPNVLAPLYVTPMWTTSVAPPYLLGESIVAIRNVVDPIPAQPSVAIDTSRLMIRCALCGISDFSRRSLADAMRKAIPGLVVVRVEDLFNEAIRYYTERNGSTVLQPTDSGEVGGEEVSVMGLGREEVGLINEGGAIAFSIDTASRFNKEEVLEKIGFRKVSPDQNDESQSYLLGCNSAHLVKDTDEYFEVCRGLADRLYNGRAVSDELYISLIVQAIQQMPSNSVGFILQDFPNTVNQAVLLMHAFSGVRFNERRPQPVDKASPFAPCDKHDYIPYDSSNCGLDTVVYVDYDHIDEAEEEPTTSHRSTKRIENALHERFRARFQIATGDVITISEQHHTINGLTELHEPARPLYTIGVDLSMAVERDRQLCTLLNDMHLLDVFHPNKYPNLQEAVKMKATELHDRYYQVQPPSMDVLSEGQSSSTGVVLNEDEGTVISTFVPLDGTDPPTTAAAAIDGGEGEGGGEVVPMKQLSDPIDGSGLFNEAPLTGNSIVEAETESTEQVEISADVPLELAAALHSVWQTTELQSVQRSTDYFTANRDIRYQLLQRRRCLHDCLSHMLMRLDQRQELFDEFRKRFNSLEPDMRFDPDCIAELHLQTVELGEVIFRMCENRKRDALEYLMKITSEDSSIVVAIHRCQCEAISFVQSELSRFYTSINLLMDSVKSVKGFQSIYRLQNELEVVNPIPMATVKPRYGAAAVGAKDTKTSSKDKDKKSKSGAVPTISMMDSIGDIPATRDLLAPLLMPSDAMKELPSNQIDKAAGLPNQKSKKEKKGSTESTAPKDPFEAIEALAGSECRKWSRSEFKVNRLLYEGDEGLSASLERGVWHEADKLKQSIVKVRSLLTEQCDWIVQSEASMVRILKDMINRRHARELTACKKLMGLIEESIITAEPRKELLLVTPDAVPVGPVDIMAMAEVIKALPNAKLRDKNVFGSVDEDDLMDNGLIPQEYQDLLASLGSLGILSTSASYSEILKGYGGGDEEEEGSLESGYSRNRTQNHTRRSSGSEPDLKRHHEMEDDPDHDYDEDNHEDQYEEEEGGGGREDDPSISSQHRGVNHNEANPSDNGTMSHSSTVSTLEPIDSTISRSKSKSLIVKSSRGSHQRGSFDGGMESLHHRRKSFEEDGDDENGSVHSSDSRHQKRYNRATSTSVKAEPDASTLEAMEYKKKMAEYMRKRKYLEEKYALKKKKKEEELLEVGMSIVEAKLAAHHQFIFEEQQHFADLEHHRPKERPSSKGSGTRSASRRVLGSGGQSTHSSVHLGNQDRKNSSAVGKKKSVHLARRSLTERPGAGDSES